MSLMGRHLLLISILFFILLAASLVLPVSPSSALVSYFEISPEHPVQGDAVKIEGKATTPFEEVPVKISFVEDLSVMDGTYEWEVKSVVIPAYKNQFVITASKVKNLYISWFLITLGTDADKQGIAKLSLPPVPLGTYNVKLFGKSDSNIVNIKIDAEVILIADASGNFEYSYDTSPIPPGQFVVTVGGIPKTIELLEIKPTPPSTPTPTPTLTPTPTPTPPGGDGGQGGSATPAPTPTPIPGNVTSNEPVSPTPTITPTPTPTSTTPQTTPSRNKTSEKTPSPTPQNKTIQSPQATKPSRIPGFEVFEGVVTLIIFIMLKRVNRREYF